MKLKTLPRLIALLLLHAHLAFTERRLRANVLTTDLALAFQKLLSDWWVVLQKELEIDGEIDDANVQVVSANDELNTFAQRASNAVLLLTKKDRTHDLYIHLFGKKSLYPFTRQALLIKLAKMSDWLQTLTTSEHPSLQALGDELPALLKRGEEAALAKKTALKKRDDFRAVGERKKFVDAANSLRKETYGKLATLPHNHTGLPLNFADQFFRTEHAKANDATPEALEEDINALKEELDAKQKEHAELVEERAKEAAEAEAEAETRAANKAKLEAIEKELAAKKKEAAALKAALGLGA